MNRRLHLSKSKNTKFNESGQLCVFHLVSSVWSLYIVITVSEIIISIISRLTSVFIRTYIWNIQSHPHERLSKVLFDFFTQEGYLFHLSSLWENYPHLHLRYERWAVCVSITAQKVDFDHQNTKYLIEGLQGPRLPDEVSLFSGWGLEMIFKMGGKK